MGVEASYLYGYGIDIEKIEWDLEYLKLKYDNVLNEFINLNRKYCSCTWKEFLNWIEEDLKYENTPSKCLEQIDHLFKLNYKNETYLTFNHKHLMKFAPKSELAMLDQTAKDYAKQLGIKNYNDIKWIECGVF